MWQYTPLILALGRQKQVDLYEFMASLVYIHSKLQDSQDYIDRPCLKNIYIYAASCELPFGCWELNMGSLEETSVLLTARDISLAPRQQHSYVYGLGIYKESSRAKAREQSQEAIFLCHLCLRPCLLDQVPALFWLMVQGIQSTVPRKDQCKRLLATPQQTSVRTRASELLELRYLCPLSLLFGGSSLLS